MSILSWTTEITGFEGVLPKMVYIKTTDNYSTITGAGYLNTAVEGGLSVSQGDMALVGSSQGPIWLQVSVSNGSYSLVFPVSSSSVITPTIASHIAVYNDVAGTITEDAATAINGGNIQAGLSGTAGYLASFPSTASKGSLHVTAVANTGDTITTISNVAMGQASTVSIPDPGNAAGRFLVGATATPFTSGNLLKASGTGGLVADQGFAMKSVAAAAAAGGAAAQSFSDAFCTSGSVVIGNWVTQANAAEVVKIVPGNGSFVVTSTADAGVGTFSYIITK